MPEIFETIFDVLKAICGFLKRTVRNLALNWPWNPPTTRTSLACQNMHFRGPRHDSQKPLLTVWNRSNSVQLTQKPLETASDRSEQFGTAFKTILVIHARLPNLVRLLKTI